VGLLNVNYPYPSYENGDIFLSWAELGMRAYSEESPEVAYKYCLNVIERYKRDGLAYQRYLRGTQEGAGDDILAGNASAIVGLYTDVCGIQPRYNRLFFSPHPVSAINGTVLRYDHQGKKYTIALNGDSNSISVDGVTFASPHEFGIKGNGLQTSWYNVASDAPSMVLLRSDTSATSVRIWQWSDTLSWSENCSSTKQHVIHTLRGLRPGRNYDVKCNGLLMFVLRAGVDGSIEIPLPRTNLGEYRFEKPTGVEDLLHLRLLDDDSLACKPK
jgi:hypothetical protein